MGWSLKYDERIPKRGDRSAELVFRYYRDAEPHTAVSVARTGTLDTMVNASEEEIELATMRFGMRRIVRIIESNEVPAAYTTEDIAHFLAGSDDAAEMLALIGGKECRYQTRPEPDADLFCSAAAPNDETQTGSNGMRVLAPTSRAICQACELPSTDVLCSHFSHPEVHGNRTFAGVSRSVFGALCELGREEVAQPSRCRPGGNECWERHYPPAVAAFSAPPPLALTEALDFLDAVWQQRFGAPLISGAPATTLAGLAGQAADRDSFEARMSDLADALDRCRVAPDLADTSIHGSLARMEEALTRGGSPECSASIARLRRLVRIRTALQHADRARELAGLLEELGLTTTPIEWRRAWATCATEAVEALRELRSAVRRGPSPDSTRDA